MKYSSWLLVGVHNICSDKEISRNFHINFVLQIITPGIIESRPQKGDTVTIEFSTKLAEGKVVQDTQIMVFTLGDAEVC